MVAAYEIFLASEEPSFRGPERAPVEDVAFALQAFRQALLDAGFLPEDNPEARFVEWREIFGRAGLTPRETRVLLALARRVSNVSRLASSNRTRGASRARAESD
jgi:tRNA C32,U32 (ribose-2'-O)-methylase TrmJ